MWFFSEYFETTARSLDGDLQTVMKAADEDSDWKRINFILEAWVNKTTRLRRQTHQHCKLPRSSLCLLVCVCGSCMEHKMWFCIVLEVRGSTMESFINEAQDRQRSALSKSLQAAFAAWHEQLQHDQIQFEQVQILQPACT